MLSNKLKQLRSTTNNTQSDFANKIGIARTTYAMYEQGKREPDYETLKKIANFYNVSIDYLLDMTDIKQNEEFEAWANDPESNIFFKEYIESPEERKKALLQVWEIIKKQGNT